MAQKVRWGVIGAGGIADRRTIPGMMLCDNAELVAVMEINMELAEKCRAKWGCKKAYDNEADLLADPATPPCRWTKRTGRPWPPRTQASTF